MRQLVTMLFSARRLEIEAGVLEFAGVRGNVAFGSEQRTGSQRRPAG